jgi:hypothetical protein
VFAVKTGPPLSNRWNWYIGDVRAGAASIPDSYIEGWIDLKIPTA